VIPPLAAWGYRRLLADQPLNGEIDTLDDGWKLIGRCLAGLPPEKRQFAWDVIMAIRSDGPELMDAVIAIDPNGLCPAIEPVRFANVADIRRIMASVRWLWEGWIPASRILGLASLEGVGKTRLAMDLNRRVYLGEEWPDKQKMSVPPGTPSLWLCADGQHDEMADMMPSFGLPDEAVIFPALPEDPYGNTSLDDPTTLSMIDAAIVAHKPWALFVDSLTYATSRDLCEQRTIATLKGPLVGLVQRHQLNIILLLHVSKEGQALGKRIKGITRTLLHLECPDPESCPRLRFWVEKSYGKKPPALGVTMGDSGNEYDFDPPARLDTSKESKAPEKLGLAIAFISKELGISDRATVDLVKEWEAKGGTHGTFFNARRKMIADGLVAVDDTRKPQMCHLVSQP